MSDDKELIEIVAKAMVLTDDWQAFERRHPNDAYYLMMKARRAVDAMRAYDREQRAKIDAALAPKGDPDDYRDPHLVTRMTGGPGIKEG